MTGEHSSDLISKLQEENALLKERERDLAERNEELMALKEELTAAIDLHFINDNFLLGISDDGERIDPAQQENAATSGEKKVRGMRMPPIS